MPHFVSKAQIEARLRATDVPWTVVAPSYFYENVLGVSDSIRRGVLPLPLPPGTPLDQLALADLGAVVAAILARRDEHVSQRIELAADAPTPEQMAAAFGVRAVQTPLQELAERSADLAAMYRFLAGPGYGIDVAAVRRRYPEVSFSSFAQLGRPTKRLDSLKRSRARLRTVGRAGETRSSVNGIAPRSPRRAVSALGSLRSGHAEYAGDHRRDRRPAR